MFFNFFLGIWKYDLSDIVKTFKIIVSRIACWASTNFVIRSSNMGSYELKVDCSEAVP